MKILSISEFTTTDGTAKETTISLDERPGVYFKVITGTFETPFFTKNQESVPVIMLHSDREQKNVSLSISENTLTIVQGYRQASHGYLFAQVNDDWVDSSELQPVTVDAMEIVAVKLNNGTTVNVNPTINGLNVRITSTGFNPSSNVYYGQGIITKDAKEDIHPHTYNSHQTSTDPIIYTDIYADFNRVITAYIKP